MEIQLNILHSLFFISIFILLVESRTIQTDLKHFSIDDYTGGSKDVKCNENYPSTIMNSKPIATSMETCALLMYRNVKIASINLCGNKTPNCPYLANGGSFTAWINITLEHILQVWVISGSYPQAQRPIKPLIEYPNFTLPIGMKKNSSLFFRKSSCKNNNRAYENSSWSFIISNDTQEVIFFSKNDTNGNKPSIGGRSIGGMVATLLIIGLLSLCLAKHHPKRAIKDCLGRSVFTFKELYTATKQFNKKELLGRGGFGSVYRGCLEHYDNILVAIKRINYDSKYAHKAFRAEISCLSKIQHENVVELLGWCHERGRLLLVYEYMSNGSLHEWLHNNCKCKPPLPWKLRLNILEGIAAAIEYLHTKCALCLLHRNIKSSNVMLDANFVAHLGDFGLAHLLDHQKQYKTTITSGYLEYMAPELPYTGKATKASDVYSFGILVLEVICGSHPLDKKAMEPEDLVLLYSCWRAHRDGTLLNMVDPRLFHASQFPSLFQTSKPLEVELPIDKFINRTMIPSSSFDLKDNNVFNEVIKDDVVVDKIILRNLLHLGLLCCLPNPKARPTIGMVIQVLKQIGYIDNMDEFITNVSIPSLLNTKPFELCDLMELIQVEICY